MAPGPSPESTLTPSECETLLTVARRTIEAGVEGHRFVVRAADYPPALREPRATFVTLRRRGDLRGCVGALEARRPLVEDVAHSAYAAAFRDARFTPLAAGELDGLEIDVSILSPPEPLTFTSEADLLRQIRPHVDGLTLEDGRHLATLLPAVWESLPDPRDFLRALKRKAGLPADHWSPALRVSRYTTVSVP